MGFLGGVCVVFRVLLGGDLLSAVTEREGLGMLDQCFFCPIWVREARGEESSSGIIERGVGRRRDSDNAVCWALMTLPIHRKVGLPSEEFKTKRSAYTRD